MVDLSFLGLAWILLIVAGLVFHAGVSIKPLLPLIIRDMMEYGKVKVKSKSRSRFKGTLPKRYYGDIFFLNLLSSMNLQVFYNNRINMY